jgi:glycosyltransferase involved in cell wall biosynthesis
MSGEGIDAMAPVPRLLARRLLRAAVPDRPRPDPAPSARPHGLSVVMAAHDEAETLEACLAHLAGLADEIVVVDADSGDATAEVAARGADRVIAAPNHAMLEINKNVAMAAATRRWVLVLDPDERVSPRLRGQIRAVVERDEPGVSGYWMPRRNYILGRWMRTMGMYPASQLRLVRNGSGRFSESDHHLPMAIDGPAGYLSGDLVHLSDGTLGEILHKRARYADFAARQMHARGEPFRAVRLVAAPLRAFGTQYLLLGGWLDGSRGLLYAASSAYGAGLRQVRLWQLQHGRRAG